MKTGDRQIAKTKDVRTVENYQWGFSNMKTTIA
jgi:hypothetical protein